MLQWIRQQGIQIDIFSALHTYCWQLNQHPRVHVSVPRCSLNDKHDVYSNLIGKLDDLKAFFYSINFL
ncbi:transposase [Candidatus Arsenophonus triatominarum]|uniref:transposase n=1 Tax=Candidatus Arsenophonus triatominarum TaxID=57911 RepID=UPI003CCC0689